MRLSSWKVGEGLHHHCPPASPSPALDTRQELSEDWARGGERVSGSLEGAWPALCLPFWLVLASPTPLFYLGAPSAASASLFTPHFVLMCWVLWTLIFPPESLILSESHHLLLRILFTGEERPRCKSQLQVLVKSLWVQVTENQLQAGFRKRIDWLKEQGSPGVALTSGLDREGVDGGY